MTTTTTRYADETRVATHRGRVVGYYARAMPPTTGARAWRGVTTTGVMVYATTARGIVEALRDHTTIIYYVTKWGKTDDET